MCEQILKSGLQCKIKSKTKLCHIHIKKALFNKKQNEIINLNKSLEKKSEIIKELYKEISTYKIKLFSLHILVISSIFGINPYKCTIIIAFVLLFILFFNLVISII